MKYLKQFAVIALVTFLGECLNLLLPISVPSSIYGMLLLFIGLQTGIVKLSQVEETADFLLNVMPILFVPATVSLMTSINVIKGNIMSLLLICLVSTIVVMAVTGGVSQMVIRRKKGE